MSRVFVTGGSGFVGANLVRAMVAAGGEEVHVLVRSTTDLYRLADVLPRLHIHVGSLSSAGKLTGLIRDVEPSTVFHLAAASGHPNSTRSRADTLRTDVIGTHNLLRAIRDRVEHLVYLGSNLEYGSVRGAVTEDAHVRPSSFRGAAKAASTLLVQQFSMAEDQPATIIRPFHVFGPWEAPNRVIPTFVRALLERRAIEVAPSGHGRDFVFIDDVIDACLRAAAAARSPAEIVNVGSGAMTTIAELVTALGTVMGVTPRLLPAPYPVATWDAGGMFANIAKGASVLSWHPRHSLQEGLSKTVRWMREEMASVRNGR